MLKSLSLGGYIAHALDISGAGIVADLSTCPAVKSLAEYWQTVAENFSSQDHIAALYSNLPLISQVTALKQTDVPDQSSVLPVELPDCSSEGTYKPSILLLLFVRRLQQRQPGSTMLPKMDISDTTSSSQRSPATSVSQHKAMLRSAFLVTKAATLALDVRSSLTKNTQASRLYGAQPI